MSTIAFDARLLNERGTTTAVFDFARGVERELGHRAVVLHHTSDVSYDPVVVSQFEDCFETIAYAGPDDLKDKVQASGADVFYSFNIGPGKDRLVPGVKNVQHVLFQHYAPRGEVYAYISRWLSDHVTLGREPWVPLIVDLPPADRDLREEWGFSSEATVLGRHGGYDQFDLAFVKGAIAAALERREDLCFAFLNTQPFMEHERVRFLPRVHGLIEKANFIAACDGLLHARKAGEGFGLAVAEFLAFDKPVLCWAGGKDRNHLHMVPDNRFVYRTASDLLRLLLEFRPQPANGYFRSAVEGYSPAAVMQRFREVFLDGPGQVARWPRWPVQARFKLANRAIVLQGRLWRDQGLRELRGLAAGSR